MERPCLKCDSTTVGDGNILQCVLCKRFCHFKCIATPSGEAFDRKHKTVITKVPLFYLYPTCIIQIQTGNTKIQELQEQVEALSNLVIHGEERIKKYEEKYKMEIDSKRRMEAEIQALKVNKRSHTESEQGDIGVLVQNMAEFKKDFEKKFELLAKGLHEVNKIQNLQIERPQPVQILSQDTYSYNSN